MSDTENKQKRKLKINTAKSWFMLKITELTKSERTDHQDQE